MPELPKLNAMTKAQVKKYFNLPELNSMSGEQLKHYAEIKEKECEMRELEFQSLAQLKLLRDTEDFAERRQRQFAELELKYNKLRELLKENEEYNESQRPVTSCFSQKNIFRTC
jgi:hypothetical protein